MRARWLCLSLLLLPACDDDGSGGAPPEAPDVEIVGGSDAAPVEDALPAADAAPVEADAALPVDALPAADAAPVEADAAPALDAAPITDAAPAIDAAPATDAAPADPLLHREPDSREAPFPLTFDEEGRARARFVLDPAGDEDFFAFTLDAPADVEVETHAVDDPSGCAGDTVLDLYDAAGGNLGHSEDRIDLGNPCSLISPRFGAWTTQLPAGDYVAHASGRTTGENWLVVHAAPALQIGDPCAPNDVARPCPGGAFCDERGEAPVCAAHACGDGIWSLDEGCDDGNLIDGDGCDPSCQVTPIFEGNPCEPRHLDYRCAADAYCDDRVPEPVCVRHSCGDGILGPEERCDDANDQDGDGCSTACALDPTNVEPDSAEAPFELIFDGSGVARITFELDPRRDEDFFAFTLAAPTPTLIETFDLTEAGCEGGDPDLELYDEAGALYLHDDNGGFGECARMAPEVQPEVNPLPAGRWLIKIRHYSPDNPLEVYRTWLKVTLDP